MRITPSSTINLYANVDNESDERLIFSTRAKQIEYFNTKRVRQEVNCTVVRKSGALRVSAPMSVVCTCNYISFINPSFDNKEFYGYITNYEYVNNECTEITYQLDYWQSYMFDVTFQNMYIEREHLSQADYDKAEVNPYDPTIFEFRTAETLPISKDLEKLTYTIGDSSAEDGFKMTEALASVVPTKNSTGALIKLSNIDLDDLESRLPGTARRFAQYLVHIVETITSSDDEFVSLGFFCLTYDMGEYLETHYQSLLDRTYGNYHYAKGEGWKASDDTIINPMYNSKYMPACCYIYDPYGGDFFYGNGHMSELISILTQISAIDSIIDIKVIPDSFMILAGKQAQDAAPITFAQQTAKTKISVTNKKLMRYPFSYLRVMAPNGDIKELQYERFSNVQAGEDACYITSSLDFSDQPTLILAPKNYKMAVSNVENARSNIFDAVLFDQFPSMPYTTDAYLAQIASVANATIANRTVDAGWDLAAEKTSLNKFNETLKMISTGVSAAPGASDTKNIIALGKAALDTASAYNYGSELEKNRGKLEAAEERWNGADYALGGMPGNAIAQQLELSRPAYACDKYYQGNGCGVTNFNNISMMDIIILRVSLSPDVRVIYDNYFSHYGYTSGRCGIPRAIQFARGASQDADLPHWTTLNGKETTYVKTMDCKVIHSMLPVVSYIKSMLDGGVRFIKGDIAQPGGNE